VDARDVVVDSVGNIASFAWGTVAKIDGNGDLLWNRGIAADPEVFYRSAAFDGANHPIVGGMSENRPYIAKFATRPRPDL